MSKVPALFTGFILIFFNSFAEKDTVIVNKDARLDMFTTKVAAVNKLTAKMTSTGQYRGFRLQVVNTRNREDAFKIKSDLLRMFPAQKSYIMFQSPYFKVRIGNFLKKPDAVAFQKQFSKTYHQNVYVVEDIIEYTYKEEEEDPALN